MAPGILSADAVSIRVPFCVASSSQVRLCLDCKDYMRAQILSKKISPRAFSEGTTMGGVTGAKKKEVKEEGAVEAAASDVPPLMALKLKYYELMIR